MKTVVNRSQADGLNPDVLERERRQPAEQRGQFSRHFPGDMALLALCRLEAVCHFELRGKVRRNLRWLAAERGMDAVLRAELGHDLGVDDLS